MQLWLRQIVFCPKTSPEADRKWYIFRQEYRWFEGNTMGPNNTEYSRYVTGAAVSASLGISKLARIWQGSKWEEALWWELVCCVWGRESMGKVKRLESGFPLQWWGQSCRAIPVVRSTPLTMEEESSLTYDETHFWEKDSIPQEQHTCILFIVF